MNLFDFLRCRVKFRKKKVKGTKIPTANEKISIVSTNSLQYTSSPVWEAAYMGVSGQIIC